MLWVLAYAGTLWLWPYHAPRLVAPLAPVLVMGAAVAAAALPGRWPGRVVAAWAVLLVAASAFAAVHGDVRRPYEVRQRLLAPAVQAIDRVVEADAVVGAPELWPALILHTDRRAAPSAPFRPGGPGPSWGSPGDQFRAWEAGRVDYLLLELGGRIHGDALDVLDGLCPGAAGVVASWEGGALVRLAWDEACRRRAVVVE
ncbi:MAG: hypothetical protein D6701_09365 [Gemmatimonadetes bacterium]|nr:MAG: hypothetical protein D6701_09365 [Gemmatimonadota bacterium]